MPISGPILKIVALKVAEKSSVTNFKASNGWLCKFKETYGIKFRSLKDKSKSADTNSAIGFLKKVKKLIDKYESKNIGKNSL